MKSKTQSKARELFLKDKPTEIAIAVKRKPSLNARKISETTDTTYSHAVRVLNKMEKLDLLNSKRKGRSKKYSLTEKGDKLSEGLIETFGISPKDSELERNLD
ncbi:winged helix DNA-binding protein [Candidatus Nanohalococcus occultus]|uniref:winged helix DNA-binding protein n=1 Tax=Candidatus Nanohalococcus occultus TaxID=2978047 RepID=UPI0039E1ED12